MTSAAAGVILYIFVGLFRDSRLTLEIGMDITLMNLRRYAIDNRVEIRFVEPDSNCVCLISDKGLVKVPAHPQDIRIEDVIAAADSFEVVRQDKPQRLTRTRMAEAINEAFKNRNFATAKEED